MRTTLKDGTGIIIDYLRDETDIQVAMKFMNGVIDAGKIIYLHSIF